MHAFDAIAFLHAATLLTVKLCGPPLLAALAAGVLTSALQAVTQINDSTLSFLPKMLATGVAATWTGPFIARALADFAHHVFDGLIAIGGQ